MAWLMSNKLKPLLRLCLLQLRLLGFSCNLSVPILNIIDNLKLYRYKILTNTKSPLEICRACHMKLQYRSDSPQNYALKQNITPIFNRK